MAAWIQNLLVPPCISGHISAVSALFSEDDHWSSVLQIIITFVLSSDLIVLHPDTVMEIQLAGLIYFFHDKNRNLSASCKASMKLQNKTYAQAIEWWLQSHRLCGVYWSIDFGSWNGKSKNLWSKKFGLFLLLLFFVNILSLDFCLVILNILLAICFRFGLVYFFSFQEDMLIINWNSDKIHYFIFHVGTVELGVMGRVYNSRSQ